MHKDFTKAAEVIAGTADIIARIGTQSQNDIEAARAEAARDHAQRHIEVAKAWDSFRSNEFGCLWRRSVLTQLKSKIRHQDAEMLARDEAGPTEAMAAARRWVSGTRPILVLLGPTGPGKSVAATWSALESVRAEAERIIELRRQTGLRLLESPTEECGQLLMPKGIAPAWVPASRIPRTFDPWTKEAKSPRLAWTHPFLVVDDLGAEQLTPRWKEAFGMLVDERLSCDPSQVRTVFTTNLLRGGIRPRYGDRIADRLNANSVCVEIKAESMRGTEQGL